MTPNSSSQFTRPPSVSVAHATSLLSHAFAGPARPIDDVIDRLARSDGERWFTSVVDSAMRDASIPASDIASSTWDERHEQVAIPSLQDCAALKRAAKDSLRRATSAEARVQATLIYFIAVGTALALHEVVLTSMPRVELEDVLVDLADAAPKPWNALLRRGVLELG